MVGQDPARFRRSTTATRFPCEASDQAKDLALPLPSTTTSYSSGCDTFFPPRVNSSRSFHALAATISITTRNSGCTRRETTRSIKTGRAAPRERLRENSVSCLRIGISRQMSITTPSWGREQQINRFPAAAGSSGSGSYFTEPDINPHSQVWQTPARQDQRTGTSQASASSSRLWNFESQETVSPARAKETLGRMRS